MGDTEAGLIVDDEKTAAKFTKLMRQESKLMAAINEPFTALKIKKK